MRTKWRVTRNAQGYWVPAIETATGGLFRALAHSTQAGAQRVADRMNAEEDDFTREKYKPHNEEA